MSKKLTAQDSTLSKSDLLSVGEVASRSGVAVSTLHFYEAEGLIRSIRNAGNHRRYFRGELRKIAVIKVAQRSGVPLKEIAEALAALPDARAPTGADWRALAETWRELLNQRIERLIKLRDQMSDCIGCGCLSMRVCPLRNPNDKLAGEGAGPRLLDPAANERE
jgi:MerR family transcriptional regulator, redox-sensitive transcriptional activator SoxR